MTREQYESLPLAELKGIAKTRGIEPLSERDIGESGGNEYSFGASRFTCRACKETYGESAEMVKKG